MIDPIPVKVKFDNMALLEPIKNISYGEDADIEIVTLGDGDWTILTDGKVLEHWTTLKGVPKNDPPIIYISGDPALLPYCMKDRLAYLQDKINKEKGRYV